MLPITHQQASSRLDMFLPLAGGAYAKKRNYDYGAHNHDNVSRLSAALRRRTILEQDVIKSVLGAHSYKGAEKYIQEVFWRTYWKGWLEMRPSLWADYCNQVKHGFKQTEQLSLAMTGQTGIEAFDSWHKELTETNYLHNHARMWFASIWIHTFGLPWQAGAALFMSHLLDGDPASNTLGWRWVAGLQTRGKAYGARADNIDQFTNGRFAPYGQLNEDVAAIPGPENPPAMSIREPRRANGNRALLLLTPEDCHPESLPLVQKPVAVAHMPSGLVKDRAQAVMDADNEAMKDALARASSYFNITSYGDISSQNWQKDIHDIMAECGADHIIMPFQPVGFWHDLFSGTDLPISEILRPYDNLCWPHAKKGFFPFKEKIPHFISSL